MSATSLGKAGGRRNRIERSAQSEVTPYSITGTYPFITLVTSGSMSRQPWTRYPQIRSIGGRQEWAASYATGQASSPVVVPPDETTATVISARHSKSFAVIRHSTSPVN